MCDCCEDSLTTKNKQQNNKNGNWTGLLKKLIAFKASAKEDESRYMKYSSNMWELAESVNLLASIKETTGSNSAVTWLSFVVGFLSHSGQVSRLSPTLLHPR
jgi:hypothetical protein